MISTTVVWNRARSPPLSALGCCLKECGDDVNGVDDGIGPGLRSRRVALDKETRWRAIRAPSPLLVQVDDVPCVRQGSNGVEERRPAARAASGAFRRARSAAGRSPAPGGDIVRTVRQTNASVVERRTGPGLADRPVRRRRWRWNGDVVAALNLAVLVRNCPCDCTRRARSVFLVKWPGR